MVQHYTRIIGEQTFNSLVLSVVGSQFFGWNPEAGVTDLNSSVMDTQAQAALEALLEGATSVEECDPS